MRTSICIFEDEEFRNLLPLTYLSPVYDLRCGILTLREKITARFSNKKIVLHTRGYLQECVEERNPKIPVNKFEQENILFINGRLLIRNDSADQIKKLKQNSLLLGKDDSVVAANLSRQYLQSLVTSDSEFIRFHDLAEVNHIESDISLIKYPWELVNANGNEIENDFVLVTNKAQRNDLKKKSSVEFKNKKRIFISKDASIEPFVFLDASDGPIYIGKNAKIMSHSSIQGPAFIGESSIIKMHASIYHNTSIGEVCKVGGEVEHSIIHSYSNKQHEGFLGHSYLGRWINIGASTNNSDLKNNYENISVHINGKNVNTGLQFVGLIMGDHSKTAINTMFNTGTIIGVSCNIFGAGFTPRYIPSFSWGGSDSLKTYNLDKALEAAKLIMERRKQNLSDAETNLLRKVFEMTAEERSQKASS